MVILFLAWLTEDQCKTEEELPPLMLGDDFKCKNFYPDKNKYFHLHGGKLYTNNAKNSHDAILIWMGTGHSGCCLWYLSTIKYIWKWINSKYCILFMLFQTWLQYILQDTFL